MDNIDKNKYFIEKKKRIVTTIKDGNGFPFPRSRNPSENSFLNIFEHADVWINFSFHFVMTQYDFPGS